MKHLPMKNGLRIESHGAGGYFVIHEASNLTAVGRLRQRRFAEQARDELLATGVDFTQEAKAIQKPAIKDQWSPVYLKWRARASNGDPTGLDRETFEHYTASTRYGQFIPNEAQAAEMRELAARLRRNGRTASGLIDGSAQYLTEFVRMGLVLAEEGTWIWIGDPA